MSAKRNTHARKGPLTDLKADVAVERNGAMIKVEGVPAAQAGVVLADILSTFRLITKKYPELVVDLGSIPGGSPTDVVDDDYADESRRRKRVGF